MSTPTKITDHSAAALGNLLSQFRDASRLRRYISVVVDEIQRVENVSYDVLVKRLLNDAEGVVLDVIGKIVGWPRLHLTDDLYRKMILVAVQIYQSDALAHEAAHVVAQMVGSAVHYVAYTAHYGLEWSVSVDSSTAWLQVINSIMPRITAKGVSWELIEGGESAFTLDTDGLGLDDGELTRRVDTL